MPNVLLALIISNVLPERFIHARIRGGSAEREQIAVAVKPRASSLLPVVTIVTAPARKRMAFLKLPASTPIRENPPLGRTFKQSQLRCHSRERMFRPRQAENLTNLPLADFQLVCQIDPRRFTS